MGVADILSTIDREIAILQQARALLSQDSAVELKKAGLTLTANATRKKQKKHRLTPEGRRRIAEAVKRRWEKHRKEASR